MIVKIESVYLRSRSSMHPRASRDFECTVDGIKVKGTVSYIWSAALGQNSYRFSFENPLVRKSRDYPQIRYEILRELTVWDHRMETSAVRPPKNSRVV